jgi:TIR domain
MAGADVRGVFLSYSRANEDVVTIAAKLLKAGGATVFQDVVNIEYGANWQAALSVAIKRCERVLVFWSAAAATSEWVEREWRAALKAGKRIVPMLLDKTPLPKELSAFHGMPELMDLLWTVKRAGRAEPPLPPPPAPPVRSRPLVLVGSVVAVCVVMAGGAVWWSRPGDVKLDPVPLPPVGPASGPASAPPWIAAPGGAGWWVVLVVALLFMFGAWLALRRRASKVADAALEARHTGFGGAAPSGASEGFDARTPWSSLGERFTGLLFD